MRFTVAMVVLLLAVAATSAAAQEALLLRGKFSIPQATRTPTPGATLRGPIGAGVAQPAPGLALDASALPKLGQSFAGGLPTGGFSGGLASAAATPALPSLAAVGDPAPVCRSTCSKARLFCATNGDETGDCSTRWVQCTAACSVGAANR